ncbi:MAG: phytoene desaturase family protein [Woeseiaceae bacterium]
MDRYDAIIIGAGHNGLVCATYLAKAGQRVLLLEASAAPGGLAASHEFHPGFCAPAAHTVNHFSQKVVDDLKLSSHGFVAAAKSQSLVGLSLDQQHVVVEGGSVNGVSGEDAAAYQDYNAFMQRFAKILSPFWQKPMPRIGNNSIRELLTFAHMGLNIRLAGKKDMRELLRVASLPARDLADENFEHPLLKATSSWDGLVGAKLAPRSPNSAVLAMLYRMAGVAGSPGVLVAALNAAAAEAGAEIRCDAKVDRILIDGSADGLLATGIQLRDGEQIECDRVISSTDPKTTFLKLVGVEHLDIGFTNRIRRLRCDGYVAKLHLALRDKPEFSGYGRIDGRMLIAPDMETIELAFDNAKYGECPETPVMEITVPSEQDPSLAPDGQHVLSAHVMYVPYKLKAGWTDTAREQMAQRAVETIATYAPGLRDLIIGQEFLTPADIEERYRVSGGHWHHTEFAMDQMLMMRPTYEAAQYGTPVPGLYLCGAGSHPGGDLVGSAGHNAAQEILR